MIRVETLVKKLCSRINERLNEVSLSAQIDISFDAHFDLVTIHPFYDGNGRASRLLMNFLQLLFHLPMCIVFKEDRSEYFESLVQTRQKEDITVFRKFMYNQYAKYLRLEIEKFEEIKKDNNNKESGYSFIF